MNVYFARSIRGDHITPDQIMNRAILDTIKRLGHTPALELPPIERDPRMSMDRYIYLRDLDWINRCQALIAEVSNPSLGVGYELAYAYFKRGLPVLCLAVKDAQVSAMIGGRWDVFYYRGSADLGARIETFLLEEKTPWPI